MTYPSSRLDGPIVPRPREGHRRRFSDADKQRILEEAAQPRASIAEVARRYGIARRVVRRWKQEMVAAPALAFVTVQITDADAHPGRGRTKTGRLWVYVRDYRVERFGSASGSSRKVKRG